MIYVLIILGLFWVYMLYALIKSKIMRVRIKEDGTIWEIEDINDEFETVRIRCTDEYIAYYRDKFGSGINSNRPVDNEYPFDEIEFMQ